MPYSTSQKLRNTLIAEAGGLGYIGMVAVAQNIMTRMAVDGKTADQVISQAGQYDGYSRPGPAAVKAQGMDSMQALADKAFSDALAGTAPITPGAGAYFYAAKGVDPANIAPGLKAVGEDAGHVFYSANPQQYAEAQRAEADRIAKTADPYSPAHTSAMNTLLYGSPDGPDAPGVMQASIPQAPSPMPASLRPAAPIDKASAPFMSGGYAESKFAPLDLSAPPGSIRALPLSPTVHTQIQQAYQALGDPTLGIKVSSAGQTSERNPAMYKKPGGWTGSTRHDDGNAADIKLTRNGQILPYAGNEHIYAAMAQQLAAAGATGIGISEAGGFIHTGGGPESSWGYGTEIGRDGKARVVGRSKFLKATDKLSIDQGRLAAASGFGPGAPTPAVRGVSIPSVPKNTATDPIGSMPSFSALQSAMSKSPAPIASDVVQSTHAMLSGPPAISSNIVQATHDALKAQGTSGLSPTAVNIYASNGMKMPSGYSTSVPSVPAPPPQMQLASIPAMPSKSIDTIGAAPRSLKNVQADDIGSMPSFGELQSMMGPQIPAMPSAAPKVPTSIRVTPQALRAPVPMPAIQRAPNGYSYQQNPDGSWSNISRGSLGYAVAGRPYSSKAQQIAQAGGFDANGGYIGGGIGFGGY